MTRILFVCTGNTCRSPMAAFLAQCAIKELCPSADIKVESAGLSAVEEEVVSEPVRRLLAEEGIDAKGHRSANVDRSAVNRADLILVMTAAHKKALARRYEQSAGKTFLLSAYPDQGSDSSDISDPYGQSEQKYRQVLEEIRAYVKKVLLTLKGGGIGGNCDRQ